MQDPSDFPPPSRLGQSPLFKTIFPGRLSKGDLKKVEIIEATIELVSEYGFEDTSYDLIGERIGTRRSHIAYHFKEKADLYLSCIRYMMAKGHEFTFAKMKEAKDQNQMLEAYLDGYFGFFVANPKYITTFTYFYYGASYDQELRSIQIQIRQDGLMRIEELLRQTIRYQEKSIQRNFSELASSLQALIIGRLLVLLCVNRNDLENDFQKAKNEVLAAAEKIFRIKF